MLGDDLLVSKGVEGREISGVAKCKRTEMLSVPPQFIIMMMKESPAAVELGLDCRFVLLQPVLTGVPLTAQNTGSHFNLHLSFMLNLQLGRYVRGDPLSL